MSFVHVTQPSSGGGGVGGGGSMAERSLFIGFKVPDDIKKMISVVAEMDTQTFRLILGATVAALEGKEVKMNELMSKISTSMGEESLYVVISGTHRLLQLALRLSQTSLKQETMSEDLKTMKIPDAIIPDLVNAVFGQRRAILLKHALDSGVQLTKLEAMKWRVDVGISTSVLNRLLEPSVSMEMTLNDGSIHQVEMSIHKFHELRFNVAHVLREIELLEKRSILKIQD